MKYFDNLGITQLKGQSSFMQWKQSLMDALDSLELSGWVTGQRKAPPNPGAPDELDNPFQEYHDAYKAALDRYSAWLAKDAKTRIILRQSATPLLAAQMKGSAKDMFELMCARFEDGMPNVQQTMYEGLLSMETEPNETLKDYVERWTDTLTMCLQAGIQLDENKQIQLFIDNIKGEGGLSLDWADDTRDRLRGPDKLTLDTIIKSLLSFWKIAP